MKISPLGFYFKYKENELNNAFEILINLFNPEYDFDFSNLTYQNTIEQIKNIPINDFSNYLKTIIDVIKKKNISNDSIQSYYKEFIRNNLPGKEKIKGYIGTLTKKGKKEGIGFFSEKLSEQKEISMLGNFSNNKFIDGTILLNKQILKIGNFENGFEGLIIEDINKNNFKIVKENNGIFNGIELINTSNNDYSVFIKTNNFIFSSPNIDLTQFYIKVINNEIFGYSNFYFKKDKYFYALNSTKIKCLFKLITEKKIIISYQQNISEEKISNETKVNILYENNDLYIGSLLVDKINYNEGEYIIRESYKPEMKIKCVGKWENGKLIKGKIYDMNTLNFEGNFEDNKPKDGKCFFDSIIYEGEIKDFQIEGKGKLIYENGDYFEGNFFNNKPQGEGTLKINNKEYRVNIN